MKHDEWFYKLMLCVVLENSLHTCNKKWLGMDKERLLMLYKCHYVYVNGRYRTKVVCIDRYYAILHLLIKMYRTL